MHFLYAVTKQKICIPEDTFDDKTAVIFHPRKDGDYSGFVFSEERCQTAFLQFGYHFRGKYVRCPEGCNPLALGFQ